MSGTLFRLAIALLTFSLGISATMLWVAYRMPDVPGMYEQRLADKVFSVEPPVKRLRRNRPVTAWKRVCDRMLDGYSDANKLGACLRAYHKSKQRRHARTDSR